MYAVIRAGGKQHKVAKGDVISVEKVKGDSDNVEFVPLLIVDDKGKARTSRKELADARVVGKVLGEEKGPKVEVYKYRNKTGYRRHTGHRQKYTSLQISDIKLTSGRSKKADDSDAAKTDTKSEQE
ncbi:MAG: large subunit ribosomal protein [Actinomycetota bacterium]|jgi:large subunit ribosomal protein L21|nr:large subunit ribosomal protein [Actinomycetota bacterium]